MPNSLKEKSRDFILDVMGSMCKDTTELISEKMDSQISIGKRWKIGFHLALCEYCREYKIQLETIRKMAQGLEKSTPEMETQGSLRSDSKERMKRILKNNN